MIGMREGLKLPHLFRVQIFKIIFFHRRRKNAREKLRLRAKSFRRQASLLANFLNRREINVRGQILFARVRQ